MNLCMISGWFWEYFSIFLSSHFGYFFRDCKKAGPRWSAENSDRIWGRAPIKPTWTIQKTRRKRLANVGPPFSLILDPIWQHFRRLGAPNWEPNLAPKLPSSNLTPKKFGIKKQNVGKQPQRDFTKFGGCAGRVRGQTVVWSFRIHCFVLSCHLQYHQWQEKMTKSESKWKWKMKDENKHETNTDASAAGAAAAASAAANVASSFDFLNFSCHWW